jgi:hypothetical protein
MNNSTCNDYGLKIYTNLSGLSTIYIDIGNTFILPFITFINIITSLICLIVLKDLNTGVNQYFLLFTISDLIFALSCVLTAFTRCGSFCSFSYSFEAKIVELYIYIFIHTSCLLFNLLVNLDLTIKKLKSFSIEYRNKSNDFSIKDNKLKISILILVSLIVNTIIYPATREIDPFGCLVTNETSSIMYHISTNSIGNFRFVKVFVYIFSLFRGLFLIIILIIINMVVLIKYRRHMTNKRKRVTRSKGNNLIFYVIIFK